MSARNSIAPKHWKSVVLASEAKGIDGVTFEWLASQHVDTQANAQASV